MAKHETPFNDDVMTLIMGVDPKDPGQHGRTLAPVTDKDAVSLITEIRDMCEDYLMAAGKRGSEDEDKKPEDDSTEDFEEEK